jgi:hypothetical protein
MDGMVRRTVFGFPRTIYEFERRSKGFLDPWSSLKPSFLRRKIAPEILGVFRQSAKGLKFEAFFKVKNNFVDPRQLNNRWSLVFPKRTYLPPNNPHLQLWLLSRKYVPSPQFMSDRELKVLAEAVLNISSVFGEYSRKSRQKGKIAFGYNSTPFSFIKDRLGRYYAGGQSVRALHIHCLLVPPPKKMLVAKQDLSLVYPTNFSSLLFKLLFESKEIQEGLGFSRRENASLGERGMEITWFNKDKKSLLRLWQIIRKVDSLLYSVQSLLVRSFYRDAHKFVRKLDILAKSKDLSKAERLLANLVVVGEERRLEEIKSTLITELQNLAHKYKTKFLKEELEKLVEQLVINEKGDLSSFVFGERVVLRPGMGYSLLLEESRVGKIKMRINPLDILGPKGLIESSGYWFEKKIIRKNYPRWASLIVSDLVRRLS